jgi:hypothetical protein
VWSAVCSFDKTADIFGHYHHGQQDLKEVGNSEIGRFELRASGEWAQTTEQTNGQANTNHQIAEFVRTVVG